MADNQNSRQAIDEQNVYIRDTLLSIASNYADVLRDAVGSAFDTAEAGTLSAVGKDLTRSFTQLAKLSDEFALNQGRITAGVLKERDVAKQLQSLNEKQESLRRKIAHATALGADFSEQDAIAAEESLRIQKSILEQDQRNLKDIEKKIGLTGKFAGALAKIPGIGHLFNAEEVDIELRKLAASGKSKIDVMSKGFSMIGKQFYEGLLDPAFLLNRIVDGFLQVNKAAVEYQRLTGQAATSFAVQNSQLATSAQVLELMAELTKQTGLSAGAIFSGEDLGRLTEAQNLLGLSAEQAGNLGLRSKLTNTSIESYQENIVKSINKFNGLNNTAISHGVVMQDVLNTSEDISLSLGNSDSKLTAAAASARRLGLSLEDVDRIASSLLDFESSIGSELEAQLLTGKNINLARAREYALTNDLEGLSKELANNGVSAAEYAGMNRLAQESLAEALGMSRQELAKSIMLQKSASNLTDKQKADAIGVTLEQMKQMEIQQRLEVSLSKLAQAFAPLLELITPFVEIIGAVISPIAGLVGKLSTDFAPFVKLLGEGYLLLKGTQTALLAISGIQAFITAAKTSELGLGLSLLSVLGLQNAAEMYKLTLMEGGNVLAAFRAAIEETILGSIIAQTGGIFRTIGALTIQLGQQLGILSAALATNAAMTFGVGVAVAVAAALAGYAVVKSMKDGVIDPKKGPVVSGEFGTVQLNPRDQIVAGTDLYGKKPQTVGQVKQESAGVSMAAVEAKLDALISVVKQGTNIYLDGKQISRSVNRNLPVITTFTK